MGIVDIFTNNRILPVLTKLGSIVCGSYFTSHYPQGHAIITSPPDTSWTLLHVEVYELASSRTNTRSFQRIQIAVQTLHTNGKKEWMLSEAHVVDCWRHWKMLEGNEEIMVISTVGGQWMAPQCSIKSTLDTDSKKLNEAAEFPKWLTVRECTKRLNYRITAAWW